MPAGSPTTAKGRATRERIVQAAAELVAEKDPPHRRPGGARHRHDRGLQGGLLLTQVRRDPEQLRIALDAARTVLQAARPAP